MKRGIFILVIIAVLVLATYSFLKPVILFLASQQLQKVFTGAAVSIAECDIKLKEIKLLKIRVKKDPDYDFKVGRAAIQFNPPAILKRNILKVLISDAVITVNQPGKSFQDIYSQFKSAGSPAMYALNAVELSRVKLNWGSKEAILRGTLSLIFDLRSQELGFCDLKIDSLSSGDLRLKDALLSVSRLGPA